MVWYHQPSAEPYKTDHFDTRSIWMVDLFLLLFFRYYDIINSTNLNLSNSYAPHQSLPCARGGAPPNGGSEGLSIPQSAALTAPFTQGSLWRSRASAINLNLMKGWVRWKMQESDIFSPSWKENFLLMLDVSYFLLNWLYTDSSSVFQFIIRIWMVCGYPCFLQLYSVQSIFKIFGCVNIVWQSGYLMEQSSLYI